jgi:hypothetical protein
MTDVERDVEWGLDSIEASRTLEVPLRDALYGYKVLVEFMAFFHQPMHWRTIEDVQQFIGNVDRGGLHVLHEAIYKRLRDVWPADIQAAFDDGILDRNPIINP